MKRILLLLLALPYIAQSAEPWTLSRCIDYALEHNISVQQSGINVKQQEIALSTAEARRLPGISASGSQNFSFGRGLTADNTYSNTNTTSTSFSLGGEIPIFHGFDINNGIKLSRLNLQA
ncbi:MAG: TolC family protein, partial [Bacteroidales bacterium]|nr:TolC family protein [Bacteroidales bacterium]